MKKTFILLNAIFTTSTAMAIPKQMPERQQAYCTGLEKDRDLYQSHLKSLVEKMTVTKDPMILRDLDEQVQDAEARMKQTVDDYLKNCTEPWGADTYARFPLRGPE